uniref:Uncharacterized protein n=1 Tax=Meloidogyne incognita TaxID=6306 RepID=A0A914LP62_MELIC
MQIQNLVPDGTLRKVRNNIDRLFDKNLADLIRGIRNNKENESRYIGACIEDIKSELRQDSNFVKANAIEKLAYFPSYKPRSFSMNPTSFPESVFLRHLFIAGISDREIRILA